MMGIPAKDDVGELDNDISSSGVVARLAPHRRQVP